MKKFNTIVSSFGGVGSSPFLSWLSTFDTCNCPRDSDGYKHIVDPKSAEDLTDKFIFIVGNPVEAIISLYRRGYIYPQMKKLTGKVNKISIEEYSQSNIDYLEYRKQLDNWLAYKGKPVLFLTYPEFWTHESTILQHLNAPAGKKLFPFKRRNTVIDDQHDNIVSGLNNTYKNIQEEISKLNGCKINNSQ